MMKYNIRTFMICGVLFLLLSLGACVAAKSDRSDLREPFSTEHSETSAASQTPPDVHTGSGPQNRAQNFIETEDAYYYLYNKKVYVSSKDEPCFYLLCAKPDCSHSDENCCAFAGDALGLWDGRLYGVSDPLELGIVFSMNLDGSDHRQTARVELNQADNGVSGGGYDYFDFYKGCLFYPILSVADEPPSFVRTDLRTGESKRLFQDLFRAGFVMRDWMQFTGDDMYFLLQKGVNGKTVFLYRYDLTTEEVERICDWPPLVFHWYVENGIVYYYNQENGTFCEYDLASRTLVKEVRTDRGLGAAYYGEDVIYLIQWEDPGASRRDLYFYDRTYRPVDELSMKDWEDFMFFTRDKLFFSSMPGGQITGMIPASEIGSGHMEIRRLPDPYSIR